MPRKTLRKSVLSPAQIRGLISAGYLSAKGKRIAKAALAGKYNRTRYIKKRKR